MGQVKIFLPKINACVVYVFASYVRREGHLYEVFLVFCLAKTHFIQEQVFTGCSKIRCILILDEMCYLYGKFVSYLRRVLFFLV